MKKTLLLLLLSFVAGDAGISGAQPPVTQNRQSKDKIKATKTVTGYFKGFEMGDYLHATIKKKNGEESSFFLNQSESVQYFLVAHKNQLLTLTYQIVETFIPEAGGKQTIERLVAVKAGSTTDKAWWKQQQAKSSLSELRQKYEALVQQSTLNN